MADVEIDQLIVQAPGLSAERGRQLAELIAAGLERARFAPTRWAEKVDVEWSPGGGASVEQLAAAIVVALLRQGA